MEGYNDLDFIISIRTKVLELTKGKLILTFDFWGLGGLVD